jgi:hypothetical protein
VRGEALTSSARRANQPGRTLQGRDGSPHFPTGLGGGPAHGSGGRPNRHDTDAVLAIGATLGPPKVA